MSRFTNVPTINPDVLLPNKASFDTPGGGIDGGRNGLGEAISVDLSGGPIIKGSYGNCFVQLPEQHEYLNWIAARMNSGVRFMNVQLLTDWNGPFPIVAGVPVSIVGGIPHSDGALFSDGSGYSQATVWAQVMEAAGQNAGIIRVRVYNAARPFRHSDWFSIFHDIKGWRAYRYWDVLTRYDDGIETIGGFDFPYQEYSIALEVPLREPVPAGRRIELARPRCVMKFPAGFTLPWEIEGFYESRPTINFHGSVLMEWVPKEIIEAMATSHRLGVFIRVDTDPALHLWLGINDVPANFDSIDPEGTIYLGGGMLVGVPTLEVLVNGTSDAVEFSMSGIDPSTGSATLDTLPAVRGKEVSVGFTTLDDYFQPMSSIIPIWGGVASHPSETSNVVKADEKPSLTLGLSVVTGEATRSRAARSMWSSSHHLAKYPGDLFCNETARLAKGLTLAWPIYSD